MLISLVYTDLSATTLHLICITVCVLGFECVHGLMCADEFGLMTLVRLMFP